MGEGGVFPACGMAARPLPCAPRCKRGSARLPDTPQARRATQHPLGKGLQTLLPTSARPAGALCSPAPLAPWSPRKGVTDRVEKSLGLWNVFSTCFTPSRAHCLFPEEGQSCVGSTKARPRAVGVVAGQGEAAKCPSQIPTALEIPPSTRSRALPPSRLCQGLVHRWGGEEPGERWDMCHLIRESPWYSSVLSPTTCPVLKVQVSLYFSSYFSMPAKRSLEGFCLLQASAPMGMTHQHSQLMTCC